MKTFVFSSADGTKHFSYLTNKVGNIGNLFINEIQSVVSGVKSIGLSAEGQALGLPSQVGQTTELTLKKMAIDLNMKLEMFDVINKVTMVDTACNFIDFQIPSPRGFSAGVIDNEALTVDLEIAADDLPESKLYQLIPVFRVSDGATVTIDAVNGEEVISGVTRVNFVDATPKSFFVTSAGGGENLEFAVTITVIY